MQFLSAYVRLIKAIHAAFLSTQVQALILVCILIALAQATVFARIEGWRFLDAFYFSVVSMATVGYGDFAPKTSLGKIAAMAFLLVGIGVFVLTVSTIAQTILRELSLSERHPTGTKEPDDADSL
ncbi:potassium channel family protein [Paracoccus sp. CPCC 101403]|uniref:Potassium channel family protein n=2 Tax=Paracoccus broussonetiae TaxID=3075834 RepID=A0ABU3EET9_9RHOB|nr:potassium channel family protein [Paracoccus sp. CPCC 101403]MDT1062650.1 potassium channel family protein [Paracoccus sp. CPCC 101403]